MPAPRKASALAPLPEAGAGNPVIKKIINKKKKSAAVSVSSAAVESPAAPAPGPGAAAAPAPIMPAPPEASKTVENSTGASSFPFEAVKPEELPAAALSGKAAVLVNPAGIPKPAAEDKPVPAAKPVELVKPAAEVKPVTVVKPAEPLKPAAVVMPAAAPEVKPAAPKPAVVQAPPAVAGAGFEVGKTHTVTGGDTLWGLSGKYYNDPYKWGTIYNANLGSVKNPDRIYPKEELVIPGLTEVVKPAAVKAAQITGGETVKEAEFTGSDVRQADEASAQKVTAAVPSAKTAPAELGDVLKEFDANDLSEEMPEHQKEWSAGVMIVPDSWQEDGVVASAEGDEEQMDNSLSVAGDAVLVTMTGQAEVKKGDYLSVYMKGATAYDKSGKKLGREIQRAGTLRVLSAEGRQFNAEVVEALTAVIRGYVVKKK